MITDLPVHDEMLKSAMKNISFFLETFYILFENDWEEIQQPPIDETESQRKKRILSAKDAFIQSGLVILFNSAEIYLKSHIAKANVFLLLKDVRDAGKNGSFFDKSTLDANGLPPIYECITSSVLSKNFKDSYDLLRKERNKVIHLGFSNIEISSILMSSFFILLKEVSSKSLWEACEVLTKKNDGKSSLEQEAQQKYFSSQFISILKSFFDINSIIKSAYSFDNPPVQWAECPHCHTPKNTLAIISNRKSVCLSCSAISGA
ncbi:hypothetical protein RIN66_07025 [Hafnia alvei]|uniref:hypothetical protein n=1 Tax=Hafnia alvei TaxID=569 RepID=UPI0028BD7E68|nr:hypothetical protein [Hafnia alvei]WNN53765.1 hypothetical protein RIN66_07025 [Hafnia alvei]